MKVEELADRTLVVSYDGSPLARFMFGVMVVFLGTAAYDVFLGARGTDRLVGLLGASATCLVIAIVCLETAWFEFSAPTHLVTWRRRWGFRHRSGTIPFAMIQSVMVERPLGDDGTPSRRINLRTMDGAEVPLTVSYRPDADESILKIAAQIRTVLGRKTPEAAPTDEVSALIEAGETIEAIKLLRRKEGLSLVDAKERVDELRKKASSR